VTEQEVRGLLGGRLERLSPAAADELRHPDYVLEMPQSGDVWAVEAARTDHTGADLRGRDHRVSRRQALAGHPLVRRPARGAGVARAVVERMQEPPPPEATPA
jgi:hypothetical protein